MCLFVHTDKRLILLQISVTTVYCFDPYIIKHHMDRIKPNFNLKRTRKMTALRTHHEKSIDIDRRCRIWT